MICYPAQPLRGLLVKNAALRRPAQPCAIQKQAHSPFHRQRQKKRGGYGAVLGGATKMSLDAGR